MKGYCCLNFQAKISVSRFLNAIDPFNLGVLLSRFQIKNDRIYGVCSYKSSKFVPDYEKSKVQVLNALNTLSTHPIWQSNQESVTKIKGTFVFTVFQRLMFATHAAMITTLKKEVFFLYLCIKSLKDLIPTTLKYTM